MDRELRRDADRIIAESLQAVMPDEAVRRALQDFRRGSGRLLLVAAGKAAWQMAAAAVQTVGKVDGGVVVTKYNHVKGEIPGVICCVAGHPVPDENGFQATAKALELVRGLKEEDIVLFLLSGGGSALFEQPLIPGEELQDLTGQLLASGADIVEMNSIRKRLSGVKGGRFAQACAPARVFSIVLSDILGDPLDMIASGPAVPDASTCEQAVEIAQRYKLRLSSEAQHLLRQETPKKLDNVTTLVTGSVRELCSAAAGACRRLGYEPIVLTDQLCCEAREAGSFLAGILKTHAADRERVETSEQHSKQISAEATIQHAGQISEENEIGTNDAASVPEQGADPAGETGNRGRKGLAFIAGGETVVHLTGKGLGGRNQELALAAAPGLAGLQGAAVFSIGSDGTDGPTDAAGGYVDGDTQDALKVKGLEVFRVLQDNDAYHALAAVDGLIITGPTGTNVNDVAVALLRR